MSNCSKHKKEVAGISDMKELAVMIGDLHYETLAELLLCLAQKLDLDRVKDSNDGRWQLAKQLEEASNKVFSAYTEIYVAWQISKPFMF